MRFVLAIQPPSDIVLDVVRAADPAARNRAMQRLQAIAGDGISRTGPSANSGARSTVHSGPRSLFTTELMYAGRHPAGTTFSGVGSAAQAQSARSLKAFQQYEAFVMQSFVSSMMPKGATATYGKGTAGQFWKSMMAQEIGKEISKSTRLGIAETALARTVQTSPEIVATPRFKAVAETAAPDPARSSPVSFFSRVMNGLRAFLAHLFGGHESRIASAPSAHLAG